MKRQSFTLSFARFGRPIPPAKRRKVTTRFLSAALLRCTFSLTLLLPAAAVHAQSIGVNFFNSTNQSATQLLPPDSAGAPGFVQANWNNVIPNALPPMFPLFNSSGAPTTAQFTSSNATGTVTYMTPSGPDEVLNNGSGTGGVGPAGALTFTLSGIPYASYSLVVYDLGIVPGMVQSVSAGGQTFFTSSVAPFSPGYVDGNPATSYTYTQGTATTAAAATPKSDYAVIPGLSGSALSFTVAQVSGGGNSTVSGFQIVNVPEPSTWALLGIGGVLAAFLSSARRRQRVR